MPSSEKLNIDSLKSGLPNDTTPNFLPSTEPIELPQTPGDVSRAERDSGPGLPHSILAQIHDIPPTPLDN